MTRERKTPWTHAEAVKASPVRVYHGDHCTARQECPWRAETPTEIRSEFLPDIVAGAWGGQYAYVWPARPICWLCRCELSYIETWPADEETDQ